MVIESAAAKLLITIVETARSLTALTRNAEERPNILCGLMFCRLIRGSMKNLAEEAEKLADSAEALATISRTATAETEKRRSFRHH